MKPAGATPVSPRHSIQLADAYQHLLTSPPASDYVVRTLARRAANGLPLMAAELVIAGVSTRAAHPLTCNFPLHFRKTYFPGRLRADPRREFDNHLRASKLIDIPEPLGCTPSTFRSCFLPGRPFNRLSPFGAEPEEANIRIAQELELAAAAGLWRLLEEALDLFERLHAGGLAHGDAELHNLIVCGAPLEILLIDFENAIVRDEVTPDVWHAKTELDLHFILREAVFVQCALGPQAGPLASMCTAHFDKLFKHPDRFRREIDRSGAN